MSFERTNTGWRATDEQVAYWEARDTCPACAVPHSPTKTINGMHYYQCDCNCGGIAPNLSPWPPVRWTRQSSAQHPPN